MYNHRLSEPMWLLLDSRNGSRMLHVIIKNNNLLLHLRTPVKRKSTPIMLSRALRVALPLVALCTEAHIRFIRTMS